MTKDEHLIEWKALWEAAIRLFNERDKRITWDRFARESFELARIVLLYQRNAIEMYEDGIHELLRSAGSIRAILPIDSEPLFSVLMRSQNVMLGGIFLASASFRLPVAVLKAVEVSADPFEGSELRLLRRDAEWDRKKFSNLFPRVKILDCCSDGPFGQDDDDRLAKAITIALIHRDDFGHGEVGQPPTVDYRRDREELLTSLRVCRILQAQRELCRWILARLSDER